MVVVAAGAEQGRRRAEAGAQERATGCRSAGRLLPAAVEQGLEREPVADPERADALGAVDLVGGERDQVAGAERDRHPAEALDGVAEEAARRRHGRCGAISATGWITPISLLTSIAATRPVSRPTARAEPVEIDEAVGADRQDLDVVAARAQPFERVEDAGMLGRQRDDPAPARRPSAPSWRPRSRRR